MRKSTMARGYVAVAVAAALIVGTAGLSAAETNTTYTATNAVTVNTGDSVTLTQDVANPAPTTTCTLTAVQKSGPATLALSTIVAGAFVTSASTAGTYVVDVICTGDEHSSASPSPSPTSTHDDEDNDSHDSDDYTLVTTWTITVLNGTVVTPYTYKVVVLGWVQSTRSKANDARLSMARATGVRSYLQAVGMSGTFAVGGKGVKGASAKARSARVVVIWDGPTHGSAITTVFFTSGSSKLSPSSKAKLRALFARIPRS